MRAIRTMIKQHGIPEELPVKQIDAELIYVDTLKNFKRIKGYEDQVNDILKHPFKLDYFCIFICTEGYLIYMNNMQTFTIKKGYCIVLPPSSIGQIVSYSKDIKIIGIACGKKFYPTELAGVDNNLPIEIIKEPMFKMSDTNIGITIATMKLIYEMYIAGSVQESTIKQQIVVLFNIFINIINNNPHIQNSKQDLIVKEFFNLLSSNVKTERRMEFYATKLCITPKYLSEVMKKSTGLSAAGWIRERIIQEAKILLLSYKYTVWQISEILGFPNESFFGTYFKKATGQTPAGYARMQQKK